MADIDLEAREAIRVFRGLLPGLNAMVRAMTGSPTLRIEISKTSNGGTDGQTIFMRPPIALASRESHVRSLCDKRADNGQQRCPACSTREAVMVTIYHEVAHICFETLSPVSPADAAGLTVRAAREGGTKYSQEVVKRYQKMPERQRNNYLTLAGMISPFLPKILNGLEDARVNSRMFEARKGTRRMFEARNWRVFTEGVEQLGHDGKTTVIKWREYPLNMQAIIGLYVKASGYDYETFFAEEIVTMLDDSQIADICAEVASTKSPGDTYSLAFKALARLRELGYCKSDRDPEDEEPEDESRNEEPESGEEVPGEDDDASGEPEADEADESPEDGGASDQPEADSEDEDADADEGDGGSPADDSTEHAGEAEGDADGGGPEAVPEPGPVDEGDSAEGPEGAGEDSGEAPPSDEQQEAVDGEEDSGSGSPESGGEPGADQSEGSPGMGTGSDPSDEAVANGAGDGGGEQSDDAGSSDSEATGEGEVDAGDKVPADGDAGAGSDQRADGGDRSELEGPQDHGERDARGGEGKPEPADDGDGTVDAPPGGDEDLGGNDGQEADESPEGGPLATPPGEGVRVEASPGADEVPGSGADGRPRVSGYTPESDLPLGEASEIEDALSHIFGHDADTDAVEHEEELAETYAERAAMNAAVLQGDYFETPSKEIAGVTEFKRGEVPKDNGLTAWNHKVPKSSRDAYGINGDFEVPESIIGPALLRMRVAFSNNARARDTLHLKAGKVNARALGKRAWGADERLFKRRTQPGKRSYSVVIGVDVSGSTLGTNLILEKEAVMAQAELLHRVGVRFAIVAHSANWFPGTHKVGLEMYHVKTFDEPWNSDTKEGLTSLAAHAGNIDGHSMEFYRKMLDRETTTDRIIMYYTDGKMPAENYTEELEILQRELRLCAQKRYTVMAVGIRTDSPREHGLDTVEVTDHADIVRVVRHLEGRLERALG